MALHLKHRAVPHLKGEGLLSSSFPVVAAFPIIVPIVTMFPIIAVVPCRRRVPCWHWRWVLVSSVGVGLWHWHPRLASALALALALASVVGIGTCIRHWCWCLRPSLAVGHVVCHHYPQPPHEQLLVAEVWEWHGWVESRWASVLS
jgi:hypothetical protein